jgi:hypothetical protein
MSRGGGAGPAAGPGRIRFPGGGLWPWKDAKVWQEQFSAFFWGDFGAFLCGRFLGLPYVIARTMLWLMKNPVIRISIGVLIGIFILAGVNWLLRLALRDHETRYSGKSLEEWRQQLESHDVGASNLAYQTLNAEIIPRLVDQMDHDTNDSKIRLWLIDTLNGLPGARINFTDANSRRPEAAECLGIFGPPAKAAVPFLIQALKGSDSALSAPAIRSLGNIHSDPDAVIPLLIPYLTNKQVADEAATALGNYGSLARIAFPKIVPLLLKSKHRDVLVLRAEDRDLLAAARLALKKIDPEAAAKIGVK